MLLRSWAPARGGVHSSACESGECNQGLRRVARRCRCRQAEMGALTSELMCGTSDGNVRYEARPAATPDQARGRRARAVCQLAACKKFAPGEGRQGQISVRAFSHAACTAYMAYGPSKALSNRSCWASVVRTGMLPCTRS